MRQIILLAVMIGFGSYMCRVAACADEIPQPLIATYFHPDRVIPRDAGQEEQSAAIRQSLDRMQKSGLNAIFPYLTGSSGQSFYAGALHETQFYGARDPLKELIDEARKRRLQVYPVVCAMVCGNDKPEGILLKHPDWGLRHPDGSPLGYLSPAHPEARKWLVSVADEIVTKYQPDGIILDYIRYHNRPLLLDVAAERRFQDSLPQDSPADEVQKLLQQFKENELTELVRMYAETVHQAKSRLGIYCWGPHVAANHQIAQCWPRWVKLGYLDLVNVSGYYHKDKYGEKYQSLFEERMRSSLRLNQETGRPVSLSFTLGVTTSHGRLHSADDVRVYLKSASEVGLDGFVIFPWSDILPFLDELDATNSIGGYKGRRE